MLPCSARSCSNTDHALRPIALQQSSNPRLPLLHINKMRKNPSSVNLGSEESKYLGEFISVWRIELVLRMLSSSPFVSSLSPKNTLFRTFLSPEYSLFSPSQATIAPPLQLIAIPCHASPLLSLPFPSLCLSICGMYLPCYHSSFFLLLLTLFCRLRLIPSCFTSN